MISLPKRHQPSVDASINIVPYIDVMLVLLVIFMMTTPIIEQGIEIDLPTAEAKSVDVSAQQPTVITINRNKEYFISAADQNTSTADEKLTLGKIVARTRARLQLYPSMKVLVKGDREVPYGAVISLMSFLQKQGINKVGLMTQSP